MSCGVFACPTSFCLACRLFVLAGYAERARPCQQANDQRRTAVADERQGDPCQRHRAGYTSDIDDRLYGNQGDDADAYDGAVAVGTS